MRINWGPSEVLLLVAVICFVLAAIGTGIGLDLVALGLAAGFGAFLVGGRRP